MVDRTALKMNQAAIVATLFTAFLLGALWRWTTILVPVLGAVMLAGVIEPRAALFKQVYAHVLRPAGILKPRPVKESTRPHNFAQLVGGIVLLLAALGFALSLPVIGWALAWVVLVLAFVNLAFDF